MLAATLLTSLLAACGGNSTSIVGAWVCLLYTSDAADE